MNVNVNKIPNNKVVILNKNLFLNTLFGLVCGFLFDDVKDLLVNEILDKILEKYLPQKYVIIGGVKFNLLKIIDLLISLIVGGLFLYYIYV